MVAQADERTYALGEWSALLEAIYAELEDRWLNNPNAIVRAENELGQIALARRLGFCTPVSLVTNSSADLRAFAGTVQCIVKPLRSGSMVQDGEARNIYTTRLRDDALSDDDAIRIAPVIVQQEIQKSCDIRVTVIGEAIFAAEIQSQDTAETETDWRRGDALQLRHRVHHLPEDIQARSLELVRALGLRFGAIDLVLDRDANYWFLEINPNGQWAWVEALTGLPIASAIVDDLLRIACV